VIGIVMVRLRQSLENMVHLVRCRIKQKKQKRRGPQSRRIFPGPGNRSMIGSVHL
jgi:hypothetical protein